jgi:hypothetical protein
MKLLEAYLAGEKGTGLAENASRLERVAHAVGRQLCAYHDRKEQNERDRQLALLNEAIQAANGSNITALEIIHDATKLLVLDQVPTYLSSKGMLAPQGTEQGRQWMVSFREGEDDDPKRPKIGLGAPLGGLVIHDIDGPIATPISNITIVSQQPTGRGVYNWPQTLLYINERDSDSQARTTATASFTGAKLLIEGNGRLSYLGFNYDGGSSYQELDTEIATVKTQELLSGVHQAVLNTVQLYDSLRTDLGQ